MEQDAWRVLLTVVSFVAFLGIVWWAYGRARRGRFDEAARLPFAEEDAEIARRTIATDQDASTHPGRNDAAEPERGTREHEQRTRVTQGEK